MLTEIESRTRDFEYSLIDNNTSKVWSIQFQRDLLKISLFNDIKMVVQGKQSNLFQLITTSIVESNLIPDNDFIQVLKSAYDTNVDKEKIENTYKVNLPLISNVEMPTKLSLLLKQAIINLDNPAKNDVEFSMYVFPALIALEGVLILNLFKCNIPMNTNAFTMFDKDTSTNSYILQVGWKKKTDALNVVKLENCYNHLYNNRHTLFHFGIIIDEVDRNARKLETKEKANFIIKETLKVIDDNYIN